MFGVSDMVTLLDGAYHEVAGETVPPMDVDVVDVVVLVDVVEVVVDVDVVDVEVVVLWNTAVSFIGLLSVTEVDVAVPE